MGDYPTGYFPHITKIKQDTVYMLKVKIDDEIDTDEIFTILMGEEVEPRREFIQTNALKVGILDI